MVTIYDVAKHAGVSAATVSRVFSGRANVAQIRVDAVRKAAKELGFVPNRNARRLRTNSSEIIAMMVPDIENPFFTRMTRAVEDVAREAGFSVMLCNTNEDSVREQEYLRIAVSEPVAGVIIVPNANSNLSFALEREIPMVCIDRHAPGHDLDTVVSDNDNISYAATLRLFAAGYSRIGCLTGPEDVETSNQRLAGWTRAVRECTGTEPDPALILRAKYAVDDDGEKAAARLLSLSEPPDAIFAANNRLATGTLRALYAQNLLPPKVGLVSFGGPPESLFLPPGIIVTYLSTRDLGMRAAEMLLERIGGLDAPARCVTLPVVIGDKEPSTALPYQG